MKIDSTPTPEQISLLKSQWRSDPCWDIENTEGYESVEEELLQYRLQCEREWAERKQKELVQYAQKLGTDNLTLAEYVRKLEQRISKLEEMENEQ